MPTNVISFFVLGVSIFLFGVRGMYLYRKQKTPLIFYYGLGAIVAGLSALMYSVPFVFTHNVATLKITTLAGDLLYYFAIIVMTRLIWYLGFNKKISYHWVLIPYLLAIIGAFWASLVYLPTIHYEFVGHIVVYPVPLVASWFFAAMSTAYIFVGLLTLYHAKTIKASKQRARLYLIGLSFLVGGIAAVINFLVFQGSNNGSLNILAYIVTALILFIGIFAISRKKSSK